jgi:hypothetical protein
MAGQVGAVSRAGPEPFVPVLCSIRKAAELLDCSPITIRRLITEGALRRRYLRASVRVLGSDVQGLVDKLPATRERRRESI